MLRGFDKVSKTTNKKNTKVKNIKNKSKRSSKIIKENRKNNDNKINKINKDKKIKKKVSIKKIILTTIIILVLLIIIISYFLLETSKFNITNILVEGNKKIDINEILTKSKIKIGDNVFKSLFTVNKRDILSIPYVSNVNTSIKFPSEFVIKIVERKSIYYAYDKEKNVYYKLDGNGTILEVFNDLSMKQDEILVYGITFNNEVILGTKINEIDYSKLLVFDKIKQEFNNQFNEIVITKVNFEDSLTKIYINDKIEIILPNDTNLKYNVSFLKDILTNIGDKKGTIDMTKENPTFINF